MEGSSGSPVKNEELLLLFLTPVGPVIQLMRGAKNE